MDVVYILGSGSLVDNKELRYSLRSLERNMLDLRDVYIVGEEPGFTTGAILVPAADDSAEKWQNAHNKVLRACAISALSDEFLLMNDDFFLLEPFEGAALPFYALAGSNGGSCGPNSYHVHCPVRIQKEQYQKMPFSLEQKACRSPRTFYANFYRFPPKFGTDYVLRVGEGMREPDSQTAGWPFFSVSDSAMLHQPFLDWLQGLYPEPSRYEKTPS